MLTVLIISLGFWGHQVQSDGTSETMQCTATKVVARRVSVSNYFSESGNFIANVAFEGEERKAGNDSWLVDVEQRTESCDGRRVATRLVFSLTAPDHHRRRDYELFSGIGYYKFHSEVATWTRAREICSEEDAHLVILNSEQESSVAVKILAKYPTIKGSSNNDWAWVGLQERASANGLPHTLFGEAWNATGFSRWAAGQPNDKTLNDFMTIHRQNGGYGDMPISNAYKLPYICEQDL